MKLHKMISVSALQEPLKQFHYSVTPSATGRRSLVMQASAGCIQNCVGTTAAAACAHCNNDPACWDQCAGAGKGACVSHCFN